MKKCSTCKVEKPKAEFSKDKNMKGGLQNRCKACAKAHYVANREDRLAKQEAYRAANKETIATKKAAYKKHRRASDPLFKLIHGIRSMTESAFRRNGYKKDAPTAELLGCTFEELVQHFESQFHDGMTWENQGTYWHRDHFFPISSGNTKAEIIKLSHYSNLRPLRADLNLMKSDKQPYQITSMDTGYHITPFLECDSTYILKKLQHARKKLGERS
jgi:hypothetical protein